MFQLRKCMQLLHLTMRDDGHNTASPAFLGETAGRPTGERFRRPSAICDMDLKTIKFMATSSSEI